MCPRIAVITSAAATQADGNEAYNTDEPGSLSYRTLFKNYGFTPKHVSVHIDNYLNDGNISTPEGQVNAEILSKADVIFFNGGDQARHARSWLNDNGSYNPMMTIISKRVAMNEVILAGTSAGSMIMCNPTYGGGSSFGQLYFSQSVGLAPKKVKDGAVNGSGLLDLRNGTKGIQYEDNGGWMPGFKFAHFLVDTHFNTRGRLGRLIPGMLQLNFSIGVGISESTCFFYDQGTGRVYGKGAVFVADIGMSTGNRQKYFSLDNVVIHYLTSGDSVDFGSLRVTSSKNLIQKPQFDGHKDNFDILGSLQADDIMTHLVDQTALYNVGYTKLPSGYPNSAPTFKLYFNKVSNVTKGYYSA